MPSLLKIMQKNLIINSKSAFIPITVQNSHAICFYFNLK